MYSAKTISKYCGAAHVIDVITAKMLCFLMHVAAFEIDRIFQLQRSVKS